MVCSLLIMALAAIVARPGAADTNLPNLGSPSSQSLSRTEEAALGRKLMAEARQRLDLNNDPEVDAYITRIGQRLTNEASYQPMNGYNWFVVRTHAINAFAGPGGYIGVNSGLIRSADTEAQLAGVMAHEAAHVSQHHIARAYARNSRTGYETLAAILAGILVGSQNPQAGEAAIAGGIAAQKQRQINYTRANEEEADRVGIGILARAGFAPAGMTEFFNTLLNRPGRGANQAPAFLQTHPLTQDRVADASARADDLRNSDQTEDSLAFHLMQTRLRVITSDDRTHLYRRWRNSSTPSGDYDKAARRYGLALLEMDQGKNERARQRLTQLLDDQAHNPHYALALARAQQGTGDISAALATYREIHAQYPQRYSIIQLGSRLLQADDQPEKALELLSDFQRDSDHAPPTVWHDLARAAEAADRPIRSHEALGEYYVRIDWLDRAMTQLQLAFDKAAKQTPAHKRLGTRIEQIKQLRRQRQANLPG